MERLFCVFKNTPYRFGILFSYLFRFFLLSYFGGIIFLLFSTSNGYILVKFNVCVRHLGLGAAATLIAGELFIGTSIALLFTRRMLMYTLISGSDPVSIAEIADKDADIFATLARFTWLSMIGISTTLVSLILASVFEMIPVWVSIDMMITQILVFFMYKVCSFALSGYIA